MSGLTFNSKNHAYRWNGRPIPGVTTLLGKGLPKPAIPYWAAKSVAEYVIDNPDGVEALRSLGRGPAVAALKGVPWEKRDRAALRGTEIHALGQKVAHGQEVDAGEWAAWVEGYAEWLDAFDVTPLYTERVVVSEAWRYAGTFDGIFTFGAGPWAGRTVLVDIKTSKGVYGETALQTAAYARADLMQDPSGEMVPRHGVDATGVVHVTEAGSLFYPLAETPVQIDEHFRVFQHVAWVANHADDIKNYVGAPMFQPEIEVA
jgi:hypothetical protein